MKIYASLAALTGLASAIDVNLRRGPHADERFLDVEPLDLDDLSSDSSLSMASSAKGGESKSSEQGSKGSKTKSAKTTEVRKTYCSAWECVTCPATNSFATLMRIAARRGGRRVWPCWTHRCARHGGGGPRGAGSRGAGLCWGEDGPEGAVTHSVRRLWWAGENYPTLLDFSNILFPE